MYELQLLSFHLQYALCRRSRVAPLKLDGVQLENACPRLRGQPHIVAGADRGILYSVAPSICFARRMIYCRPWPPCSLDFNVFVVAHGKEACRRRSPLGGGRYLRLHRRLMQLSRLVNVGPFQAAPINPRQRCRPSFKSRPYQAHQYDVAATAFVEVRAPRVRRVLRAPNPLLPRPSALDELSTVQVLPHVYHERHPISHSQLGGSGGVCERDVVQ